MLRDRSFEGSGEWGSEASDSCGQHAARRESGEHVAQCERVHRTLKRIVKARGALDLQEAAALRDAQRLQIWRRHGCAGLLEYMEREMGYTPRAALERLRVANAIEELPQIADAMEQGTLTFSGARELTRTATPETEGAWLEATADKNLRQIEEMVSGHKKGDRPCDPPDPGLRTKVLRFEVSLETAALERQARRALEKERGERLDDDALLAALFRLALEGTAAAREGIAGAPERTAAAPERTAAAPERTRAPYQVAVTICEQCKRGWQDGAGVVVVMSPPEIERARCDAEEIGSLDGSKTARAKQSIPPATRRKVLRRDHGTCRVPGCRSVRNLDLHHIVPREQGGTHDVENLVTLCEGHHLAHHRGALDITGPASALCVKRSPSSKYKTETRVVETTSALRELGFKSHEVRAAIESTRTHVGAHDLTLEQWLKIALGYCPKPT